MLRRDVYFTVPDGRRIYAADHGPTDAAHVVLCLHGLTRNHKDFDPMIAALGAGRRYIAWDTRGRGRSERDPDASAYNNLHYAQDVVALMDHLKLGKVTLVGTSMGGLISMILMNVCPDRIQGVVLNDVGPKLEQAGIDRIAGYVGGTEPLDGWRDAADAIAHSQAQAFPDNTPDDWMAFAKRTFIETDDGKVVLDYDPAIADSLKAIKIDPAAEAMAWAAFNAMKAAPLLIVRGELSDLFSAATANAMVSAHGNASEVVVPRVGHAPILNEPEAVTAISAFLQTLEA